MRELHSLLRRSTEQKTTGELLRPPALGPPRPSLVEDGASCFCVGTCRNRSHSVHKTQSVSCGPAERCWRSGDGSRLRRRLPVTGGSECPAPTGSTLGHNRRCTLVVAFEHRRKRGEHLIFIFYRNDNKGADSHETKTCGRCLPSLLAPSALAEEGGLAPSITAKPVVRETLITLGGP